jgi:hypothetical protein
VTESPETSYVALALFNYILLCNIGNIIVNVEITVTDEWKSIWKEVRVAHFRGFARRN